MQIKKIIKKIGCKYNRVRDLDYNTAVMIYSSILAGEIADLELGSILMSFRIKSESVEEIRGFYYAMQQHVIQLQAPLNRPMPIIIPSYNGARRQANLTPLLALLLVKLGFPVLLHGIKSDPSRITTNAVLAELGIKEVSGVEEMQLLLNQGQLVFISIDRLCKPIANQLLLRWRMGVRNSAHTLVKLVNPFSEHAALRITSVSHLIYISRITKFLQSIEASAILLIGTEGEVYANPLCCSKMNIIQGTSPISAVLCKYEPALPVTLPKSKSPRDTAIWVKEVINGEHMVPQSLRMQLACCLLASGESKTLEQAQAHLKHVGI
ncbi:DNA-binding protein YbiB [Candidatus Pantoea carbekii]|uniref:Glycosyl transferase family 3 N-terminal domain-containing protein n=1 Tax=Candidatus Pantoea carbekii TaxID=1235990 RepID=U3U8L2_9GAMM|nr:DNA-binding protein YbiB [Candidatus Pantoea carbekii]AKC32177.1 anthranilate phosphoribosyltransferase YbiB [Candidatus Pantoea carbekii]BAO00704.1 hypothetical protein HHS_07340 [Candidatus Pantoea carbekii]